MSETNETTGTAAGNDVGKGEKDLTETKTEPKRSIAEVTGILPATLMMRKAESQKTPAKTSNTSKTVKNSKPAKPVKSIKADKAVKNPDKTSKPAKTVKPTSKNEKPATKPNKPSKSEKPAKTASKPVKTQKQSVKGSGSEPDSSGKCYRPTSSYGKLFALLLQHKEKGIRRSDLVKEGMKVCQKPEKNILFDVAVVVSPAKDGSAHRSANNAADHYWVERLEDGLLKLHLR